MEDFLGRINEWLRSIECCAVFVIPQLHSKVEQLLVWLPREEILILDNVLEFGGVSGVINVNGTGSIVRLPALSPLHDPFVLVFSFAKLRLHRGLQLRSRDKSKASLEPRILIQLIGILKISINRNWCEFKLHIVLSLIILPVLHSFIEFCLPFFNISIIKGGGMRIFMVDS